MPELETMGPRKPIFTVSGGALGRTAGEAGTDSGLAATGGGAGAAVGAARGSGPQPMLSHSASRNRSPACQAAGAVEAAVTMSPDIRRRGDPPHPAGLRLP